MNEPSYFIPLGQALPFLPADQITTTDGGGVLERVGISHFEIRETTTQTTVELSIAFLDELKLALPGFEGFALVLGVREGYSELVTEVDVYPNLGVRLVDVSVGLRLQQDLLRPVVRDADDKWVVKTDADDQPLPFEIRFGGVGLFAEASGEIGIEFPGGGPSASVDAFMIGETGVVVEIESVQLLFTENGNRPAGAVGRGKGIFISQATVHLPEGISVVLPDNVQLDSFFISAKGFSGTISGNWSPTLKDDRSGYEGSGAGNIFGIPFALRGIALTFEENIPIAADLRGSLIVPYFQEPADVRINLQNNGDFTVTILAADEDGITLSKEELLSLTIQSLTVTREDNLASVIISGGLEPLLMASDGLEWPRLDVTDLTIEQNLLDLTEPPILKFREAWLDLKEMATLDLWGFHFELNRLGLGYEGPTDKLWIDLTGSLRLIEHLPVGLGVEGFRITWPRLLYEDVFEELNVNSIEELDLDGLMRIASQIEVKFDGVYLFYGVPNAVEFEGYIRFIKEAQKIGFAGDVVLRMPTSGFSLEAGLLVGMNFENPPYPFLYVYLGVELPKGIPLGQSGLALKGALGLFGLNVYPDKTPEQNWYYDWYKREPFVGAHQTNKWRDERMAVALGVGVTITTTDGYIKGVRGLLVLVVPGPILVLEGRSLIFDGLLPLEPPLRALAVFDGRELTVQFNIEAEAELIEDMLEAYGMLEAFFDFEDLTNWHLYLGQDEPQDRRIHANILKFQQVFLFKADAYLMLDMIGDETVRARMGVFVGFKPPLPSLGPVKITLDAVLEGNGVVTILPEQFSGEVDLSANIELLAFGFGVKFAAGAGVLTEGPDPLLVETNLYVTAEIPLPISPAEGLLSFLPDSVEETLPEIEPLEVEFTLNYRWELDTIPEITPPLTAAVADSDFVPGGGGLSLYAANSLPTNEDRHTAAEISPIVPVDARPTLMFGHDMNDETGGEFGGHPDGVQSHDVGLIQFIPHLVQVDLYEHRKGEPWPDNGDGWQLIASTATNDPEQQLWGVWLAEAAPEDPTAPAARRLRLWTTNPFIHARGALETGYQSFLGSLQSSYAQGFLNAFPGYFTFQDPKPRLVCVDFTNATAPFTKEMPLASEWSHRGLTFNAPGPMALLKVDANVCLRAGQEMAIRFPEPVRYVVVRFCKPTNGVALAHRTAQTSEEFREMAEEAQSKGLLPDFTACEFAVQVDVQRKDEEWIVEAAESFTCLQLARGDFIIREICYSTEAEQQRVERAGQQDETNTVLLGHFSDEAPILKPGSYYRLVAQTCVNAALQTANIPQIGNAPPNEILDLQAENPFHVWTPEQLAAFLYARTLSELGFGPNGTTYTQEAFFQTEGPPHHLTRYVKWSSPQPQAVRIFREDDLAIRFLRANVNQMYAHEAHQLRLMLRDASGHIVEGYETAWSKAGSATLLPDERRWLHHLDQSPDDPDSPFPHDDVFEARRLLFQDTFEDSDFSARWTRHDQTTHGATTSVWQVENGGLRQTSNLYGLSYDSLPKPGTYVVAGDSTWQDITFKATLRSDDDDAIGVIFRYQDEQNYYRFSMDRQRRYRRLVKFREGQAELLYDDTQEGFELGEPYEVEVQLTTANGATQIEIWLTGSRWGQVTDQEKPIETGQIGLYCWANTGARFSQVQVNANESEEPTLLFEDNFTDGSFALRWARHDQTTHGATTSVWQVVDGELRQTSNLHGLPWHSVPKPGTYVVAGDPAWQDIVFAATLRSDDDDAIGVIFRYQDEENYYRFSMDRQRRYRRLVKFRSDRDPELLYETEEGFELGQLYEVEVQLTTADNGATQIEVRLNGSIWGQVTDLDNPVETGQIGLYCWANTGARFSNVRVATPGLAPQARYELLVTGGEGGALLLQDEFDGDTLGDTWRPQPANGWRVENGELRRESSNGDEVIVAGEASWTDLDFHVEVKNGSGENGVVFRHGMSEAEDGSTIAQYYRAYLTTNRLVLERVSEQSGASSREELAHCDEDIEPGRWYRLRVSAIGDQVRIWLFDALKLEESLANDGAENSEGVLLEGRVGLYATQASTTFRRLRIHEAVLHRVTFTTSAFNRFRDLVHSYQGQPITITSASSPNLDQGNQNVSQELATKLAEWEQALVDFRDELLDREGLEASKVALREQRAAHDDVFRTLSEGVADLYYQPFAPELEIYNLKEDADGVPLGFWIRSPESLDLWLDVEDGGHVGRAQLMLERANGDGWEAVDFTMLHDSDSTQMILLPVGSANWASGTYRLTFTYHRNHGDEDNADDHRYDRPVEKWQGDDSPETARLEWEA